MPSRRAQPDPPVSASAAEFSIWNAPPASWKLPFDNGVVLGLDTAVKALLPRSERDNDDIVAFRTPVTPDVLLLPTQG